MASFVAFLALIVSQGHAFQSRQPQVYCPSSSVNLKKQHHHPLTQLSARRANNRRKSSTAAFYSSTADPPLSIDKRAAQSFGDRMRKLVLKEQKVERQQRTHAGGIDSATKSKINPRKPSFVHEAVSLDAYKKLVADEEERLVVVRFYAKWCRACLSVEPLFYKLAHSMPDVTFVEVPVLEENANLHQGLGVPSLPFAHIYHPKVGLVEEVRMGKKEFKNFQSVVEMYRSGECANLELDPDTAMFLSPFEHHQ